jgi:WhiB family redox-sensing transcriptional regulator
MPEPEPHEEVELMSLTAVVDAVLEQALPCHLVDPDLFFAESPADVERAKALCVDCPVRTTCLAGALARREPWGVWGGQLVLQGVVVARKRPRGRPRTNEVAA